MKIFLISNGNCLYFLSKFVLIVAVIGDFSASLLTILTDTITKLVDNDFNNQMIRLILLAYYSSVACL